MTGFRVREANDAMRTELPNIRAGIAHDLDHHPHHALRTVAALDWVWINFGIVHDGVSLLHRALEACPDAPQGDRALALIALSNNLLQAGDPKGAIAAADDVTATVPISPEATVEWRLLSARACLQRSGASAELGDGAAASENLDRYFATVDGIAVPAWIQSIAVLCQGLTEVLAGDLAGGMRTLQRACDLARECGYAWAQGTAELLLARFILGSGGDARDAVDAALRAEATFEAQGHTGDQLSALHSGAHCLFRLGAVHDAVRLRAAIVQYADWMGVDTMQLAILAGGDNEARLCDALREPDRGIAEAEGRGMRLDEISTVFRQCASEL